jgi:glycosyltransferase involved in cell wall biosynthesis
VDGASVPVVHANAPSVSVVIPAFNEEQYLPETLEHLRMAERLFVARIQSEVQVIVVDNGSTDQTVAVAHRFGATVISEPVHNIAKVRNTGAKAASHDVLVFLDADTLVPPELLLFVVQAMGPAECLGGTVDARYRPRGWLVGGYLQLWRIVGDFAGMAMGACQFCRRDVFARLNGYDETLYMGEDVDFFWRLRALARGTGLTTAIIRDLQVVPSARRVDRWPLWRTLVFTNPFFVLFRRRRRSTWMGWYDRPPR